jgi:hypothetical protein
MARLKLTELQRHEIREALSKSSSVCSQVEQKPLKGESLEAMKILETAVTNLEVFLVTTS